MTQRPVLVHIVGALNADWLLVKQDWIQHHKDLSSLSCPHAERAIRRKVHHASIKLVWIMDISEPLLVHLHQWLDALQQLICVKQGHI